MFRFARDLMVLTAMIDFSFHKSRSWRCLLLLVLFDSATHLVFIQCCLSYWGSFCLAVWIKTHHCGSFINWRIRDERFLTTFFWWQINMYILDNSLFYIEVSLHIVWVYSAYTIVVKLLTRWWHMLTVISRFLFMTKILFKQNSYSFHPTSKEWKILFILSYFTFVVTKVKVV